MEREALELGARFATRLLEDLAGPELEGRILALLGRRPGGLPERERKALRRAVREHGDQVRRGRKRPCA